MNRARLLRSAAYAVFALPFAVVAVISLPHVLRGDVFFIPGAVGGAACTAVVVLHMLRNVWMPKPKLPEKRSPYKPVYRKD